MWKLVVTPLFTIWMGMAFLVLFITIGILGYALVHTLMDERRKHTHQETGGAS